MPPKPMRSKGCKTCRRRKVKCDETRPYCKRCSHSWLACEGFSAEAGAAVFVNCTVENVTVYNNVASVSLATNQPSLTASTQILAATAVAAAIPRGPDRPFRENVWISFLASYLFPGSMHNPGFGSWIFEMINLDPTSLSYLTSCCLGAAFFGRTQGMLSDDMKAAAEYYERALLKLNENLRDPEKWSNPVNVPSAMLLGCYELVVFGSTHGFVKHAGGVGALIRSRGPEAHKAVPSRSYFAMSRLHIVSEALVQRKRTFLSEPEWQSITRNVPQYSIRQNFEAIDFMTRVPNIIADSDEALVSCVGSDEARQRFTERFRSTVVAFLRDLFVWRWEWEKRNRNLAYEVSVTAQSLSVDENRQPLFDKAIYYRHFHLGRQPGLFMVAIILVVRAAESWGIMTAPAEALASLASLERPWFASPLTLPYEGIGPSEGALEIVRSVEFYLQGEHRLAGALHLLLPLRVASSHITDVRQIGWLKRVTSRMADVHGFQFSTRLQRAESFANDLRDQAVALAQDVDSYHS